jgi:hypothetical protein
VTGLVLLELPFDLLEILLDGLFLLLYSHLLLSEPLDLPFELLVLPSEAFDLILAEPFMLRRLGHSFTTTRYTVLPRCSFGQSTLALVPKGVTLRT